MKCNKCGAEVNGNFCTECGEQLNQLEVNNESSARIEQNNLESLSQNQVYEKNNEKPNRDKSALLCLVFGIVGMIFSSIFIGFPLAVFSIVLGVKTLKKQKSIKAIIGIICSSIGILFVGVVVVSALISSANEKKLNNYIKNKQYDEAIEMLDNKDLGKTTEFKAYCEIYEAIGDYDAMVNLITEYYDSNDKSKLVESSVKAIEKLDVIYSKVSDDKRLVIDAYKNKIESARNDLAIEAQKAEAEAKKAEADATAKQAEADKAQAELDKAQAEADRAQAETEKAQAEADKAQAEADTKKAESDKAKAEADKAKVDNDEKQANNEADKEKTKKDDSDLEASSTKDNIPTKKDIEDKCRWFTYDDVMRYRDKYIGSYIICDVQLGNVVLNSNNLMYDAVIGEYQVEDDSAYGEFFSEGNFDNKFFIIVNCKKDKSLSWVKGDMLHIYGKYIGVETYYNTNRYTDKEVAFEIPVIEVYYDELFE